MAARSTMTCLVVRVPDRLSVITKRSTGQIGHIRAELQSEVKVLHLGKADKYWDKACLKDVKIRVAGRPCREIDADLLLDGVRLRVRKDKVGTTWQILEGNSILMSFLCEKIDSSS